MISPLKRLFKPLFNALIALLSLLATLPLSAQTLYGVGTTSTTCGTAFTSVFTVNQTTGAATSVGTLNFATVTAAVSPVDGQVYYIEQGIASPRLAKWNPATSTNTAVGTTTLPTTVIRMAFSPDGKLYAASNTNQLFEINPATGATIRTITHNISTGGSGDMAFAPNGDLYVVANDTVAGNPYQLWSVPAAQISTATTVTATTIGTNLGIANTIAPNGLALIPPTGSCTTSPCFAMSTGATNVTYLVNGTTGAATPLGGTGTTGACLTDLGRSYNTNFTITKSDGRNSAQTGDTLSYAMVVTNTGPSIAPFITITDPAIAGLTCTSVSCAAAGGGVCPGVTGAAALTALQGTGLQTGVMPINGSVTLTLTCTVN